VTAIHQRVEKGIAPESMLARGARFPERERPICAYPNIASYVGSGSFDSAASFRCTAPAG
jgi:feruloyl esterase